MSLLGSSLLLLEVLVELNDAEAGIRFSACGVLAGRAEVIIFSCKCALQLYKCDARILVDGFY